MSPILVSDRYCQLASGDCPTHHESHIRSLSTHTTHKESHHVRNRIRHAALAFAGASLLATSLLAPIAAAAPISQPLTETQAIKLNRADIKVEKLGGSGTTSHMVFHFRVTNDGPDDMKFHVTTRATFHAPNDSHMQSQDFSGDF